MTPAMTRRGFCGTLAALAAVVGVGRPAATPPPPVITPPAKPVDYPWALHFYGGGAGGGKTETLRDALRLERHVSPPPRYTMIVHAAPSPDVEFSRTLPSAGRQRYHRWEFERVAITEVPVTVTVDATGEVTEYPGAAIYRQVSPYTVSVSRAEMEWARDNPWKVWPR